MESGLSTRSHIGPWPPREICCRNPPISCRRASSSEIAPPAPPCPALTVTSLESDFSGKSLFGSIGGCPPFGEASVSPTPASRKTKYGAEFLQPEAGLAASAAQSIVRRYHQYFHVRFPLFRRRPQLQTHTRKWRTTTKLQKRKTEVETGGVFRRRPDTDRRQVYSRFHVSFRN